MATMTPRRTRATTTVWALVTAAVTCTMLNGWGHSVAAFSLYVPRAALSRRTRHSWSTSRPCTQSSPLSKSRPWNRVASLSRHVTPTKLWSTPQPSDAEPSSTATTKFVPPALIRDTARILRRSSWCSWWSQVILTVIAAVILLFAQSVVPATTSMALPSFMLSGLGVLVSAASIVWTWGNGQRLSRRLVSKPTSPILAANLVRRAIRVGVGINCLGLLLHLVAAQQIIGGLAIKVLVRGNMWGMGAAAAGMGMGGLESALLQPLDILIVQANANQLLSQFCSLVSLLYLTGQVDQLDPPSTIESPRV